MVAVHGADEALAHPWHCASIPGELSVEKFGTSESLPAC